MFQEVCKAMIHNSSTFSSKEKICEAQFQSAFHCVSILSHPAWTVKNDLYSNAMQELWARDNRIQNLLNKTTLADVIDEARAEIPQSRLFKYGNYRYNCETDEFYRTTSAHGADFKISQDSNTATGNNWNDDTVIFSSADQPGPTLIENTGNKSVLFRWLLVLQYIIIDTQRSVFRSSSIAKKWISDLVETCLKFITCSELNQSLNNVEDMPCLIDFDKLHSEPVCHEELLCIKQPVIKGQNVSEEQQRDIERLWFNISSSKIRSLWMEDILSCKYGALPDSLSYAMGESSNIVPITDFLNRKASTFCSENVVLNDLEAKHCLGDVFESLGGNNSTEEHRPETDPLARKDNIGNVNHANLSCLQKDDLASNVNSELTSSIHLSVLDLNNKDQCKDSHSLFLSAHNGISGTESTTDIVKSLSVTIETNSPVLSPVMGNQFLQAPFFYVPHLPLVVPQLQPGVSKTLVATAPQLQPSIPPVLPFYKTRHHIQDGQYSPPTHPLSPTTGSIAQQPCYIGPAVPMGFINPTTCLTQPVSSQNRPSDVNSELTSSTHLSVLDLNNKDQSKDSHSLLLSANKGISGTESTADIVKSLSVTIGTNSSVSSPVMGNQFPQAPFFYVPHLPLVMPQLQPCVSKTLVATAPQLQPSIPPVLPFYKTRHHIQDGQCSPPTHPLSPTTGSIAQQPCYIGPAVPMGFINPTTYLTQPVSSQNRPSLAIPVSTYPSATHLHQPHLSTMSSVGLPPAVYRFNHQETVNYASFGTTRSPPGVQYETSPSYSGTYYSPMHVVQLQSAETLHQVIPMVTWYMQPHLPFSTSQSPPHGYQNPLVFQRAHVPLSPYCASVPPSGKYYTQKPHAYSQNCNSHHVKNSDQPADLSDSKPVDKKASGDANIVVASVANSFSPNCFHIVSTSSSTPSVSQPQNSAQKDRKKINAYHQFINKKKTNKVQQNVPKCKGLLKSAYSKSRAESLKLSDFLFLGHATVISTSKKGKYKKVNADKSSHSRKLLTGAKCRISDLHNSGASEVPVHIPEVSTYKTDSECHKTCICIDTSDKRSMFSSLRKCQADDERSALFSASKCHYLVSSVQMTKAQSLLKEDLKELSQSADDRDANKKDIRTFENFMKQSFEVSNSSDSTNLPERCGLDLKKCENITKSCAQ